MNSHAIRLRGGWECVPADGSRTGSTRLTLPVRVESLAVGRLRLTRHFNRPPRVPAGPVVLRFNRSPGILSVTLNGRPVGPTSPDRAEWHVSLDHLIPRNELAIEAEPPRGDAEWGDVSLVFG